MHSRVASNMQFLASQKSEFPEQSKSDCCLRLVELPMLFPWLLGMKSWTFLHFADNSSNSLQLLEFGLELPRDRPMRLGQRHLPLVLAAQVVWEGERETGSELDEQRSSERGWGRGHPPPLKDRSIGGAQEHIHSERNGDRPTTLAILTFGTDDLGHGLNASQAVCDEGLPPGQALRDQRGAQLDGQIQRLARLEHPPHEDARESGVRGTRCEEERAPAIVAV